MDLESGSSQTQGESKPASKVTTLERTPGESGDLSMTMDFYADNSNAPAVIDNNDPNIDPDDNQGGFDDDQDDSDVGGDGEGDEESGDEGDSGDGEEGEDGDVSGDEGDDEGDGDGEKTKTTVLTIGEKDHDVPLDAVIPTPVNGEIENPTLQDLRNAYSSKSSIRKELEEVAAAKDELSAHRRKMARDIENKEIAVLDREENLKSGRQALKEQRFEDALNEFFEYNPDVWDAFEVVMEKYYSEFAKLPAEHKRILSLQRRGALNEVRQKIDSQRGELQRGIDAFNNYKKARCEACGLTEEEVEDAWDAFVEKSKKGEVEQGLINKLKTASAEQKWEFAMAEALADKTRTKIKGVIKSKFPKLENKSADIVKELEEKLSGKYLVKATKEDIAAIIARDYNQGKDGKTSKKVAPTNSLRDKAQPRHKLREAVTQEDEDDLYAQDERGEPANQVWGMQSRRY